MINRIISKYIANTPMVETPLDVFISGVTKVNIHHFVFHSSPSDFINRFDNFIKPFGLTDLQSERQLRVIKVTPELIGFNKIKSLDLKPWHTHMCVWNSRIIHIGVNTITPKQWSCILKNESKYFYYTKNTPLRTPCIKMGYIWEHRVIGGHHVKLLIEKLK